MKRLYLLFLLLLAISTIIAQAPIRYTIHLENLEHHEIRITAEFPSLSEHTLVVRMPNASPGRYAEHSFAKNVYSEKAYNAKGEALKIYRNGPSEWEIAGHDGFVRMDYTLFANYADGTYSGVDRRKVQLNMPATFIYGVDMADRTVELIVEKGEYKDWKVATQLEVISENTFRAPDYYYFYDSPTMIGDIQMRTWKSWAKGKEQNFELAMIHQGTDKELDDYADWIQRIVEEEIEVFGELPNYDFGKYTFLCSYNPWVVGDAMEHRNSTICTSSSSLKASAKGLVRIVSHEFIHCWNAERIRPASLEPFDFDRANLSGELWFVEGFTAYYDDLILCRAGIMTPEEYIEGLAGQFNYVLNSPGRQYRNPIEMSYMAPFVDDASFVDPTNFQNTFVSYYNYGAVLGTALDLLLRTHFERLDLDDYMQLLWQRFGKTEIPYTIPDLQQALLDITGDADFSDEFFEKYIYDSQLPDFPALFAEFGVEMRPTHPGKSDLLDERFTFDLSGARLTSEPLKGTTLYEAGIKKGDKILELAGHTITSKQELENIFSTLELGASYPLKYMLLGLEISSVLVPREVQDFGMFYLPDGKVGKEVRKRRDGWLKVGF